MAYGDPGYRSPFRWMLLLAAAAGVILVVRSLPGPPPEPPLELVALGPDGGFRDTLDVPAAWGRTGPGLVRVPLVLAVRNAGEQPARPERLALSLPARYRLAAADSGLDAVLQAGAPLVRYTVATGLGAVQPGRLPTLLPAHDTLWLEVVVPTYHCVALADSVPELLPAQRPPLATLSQVRIFYSFEGGDLAHRRTGTLTVRLDSTLLDLPVHPPPPPAAVVLDTAVASPETGPLRRVGTRIASCGEARDPMEIRSTLWLTRDDGRVYVLAYGGVDRKRLYDLDGDGVIERESWDADADGVYEATRRTRLPTPDFLVPAAARADTAPAPPGG